MSHIRKPFVKKGRFKNAEHEVSKGFLRATITMWLKSLARRMTGRRHHLLDEWLDMQAPITTSKEPVITWVGHSTFLIQVHGINILTDPVFFNISGLFKRNLPPGIALADLPPIDVVLISHNHWDHMH